MKEIKDLIKNSIRMADMYLEEIDYLCKNTRKYINNARITVNHDDFRERRDDLISRC